MVAKPVPQTRIHHLFVPGPSLVAFNLHLYFEDQRYAAFQRLQRRLAEVVSDPCIERDLRIDQTGGGSFDLERVRMDHAGQ